AADPAAAAAAAAAAPRFEELDGEEADEQLTAAELKERGNCEFKRGQVSAALQLYAAAINKLEKETEEVEAQLDALEIRAEQLQQQQQQQQCEGEQGRQEAGEEKGEKEQQQQEEQQQQQQQQQGEQQQEQDPREHPAAHLLPEKDLLQYRQLLQQVQQLDEMHAVLKSNRALCHLHYGAFDLAVADSTDAIRANPNYAKGYLRRFRGYEGKKKWHEALSDLNKAIELDPKLAESYASELRRVKRESEQQFEKEKEEMISKLKDLGNFVLGKVGLSLDNFKVEQNPQTGSYNIQFQQNPKP
ncbi:TPR domain-containing protein, putative, partial [Eimeria tenella]